MNKKLRGLIAATIAFVACLTVASSASALTVSPAGSLSGTARNPTLSVNGITLTCATSTISGTVNSAGSGSATSVAFNTCSQATLGSFTVTPTVPWTVTVSALSNGVRTTFSNVSATIRSSIGCSFTVTGSQAMDNIGASPLTVGTLTPTGALSRLTVSNATNCFGLVNNGNAAQFNASYGLTTPQTVTYP